MNEHEFAGRAGTKLDFARDEFNIDVRGLVCADFGSSVGGFVDCLLKRGASRVYAVEKGYGVLAWNLRNDARVVVLERTNAMHVTLPEKVDLLTIDTSWTRQEFVIENARRQVSDTGRILTLIKPHYEADRKLLKRGKLSDQDAQRVAHEVAHSLEASQWRLVGLVRSPIRGSKGGNIEYFAYLKREQT
jgi:23S rRNA (cytidine1920-2'-O)/16S rRNA (cytidine1409-2'-O)-methyltransferase